MENTERSLNVVNNLIKLNYDRVAGFKKASSELDPEDHELVAVLNKFAADSIQYVEELTTFSRSYGGEPIDGSSISGDLHRAWIDIKAAFTGDHRKAVLNECERGEDIIKGAYEEALEDGSHHSYDLTQLLERQLQGIIDGHDAIKTLRDLFEISEDKEGSSLPDAPGFTISEDSADNTAQNLAAQPSFEGAAGEYDRVPEPETFEQEEAWQEEDQVDLATGNSKLMEFFVNELKDLLWAERELAETLPVMSEAATSSELKSAFELHRSETEVHVQRLEQIFAILGLEPESRKCDAMAGILDEGDEIVSATEEGTAQRDVGLIFAGQKAEHYEIASYGGMIALAKTLGYYEVAELLVLTLDEEKTADATLTDIAESQTNYLASTERTNN